MIHEHLSVLVKDCISHGIGLLIGRYDYKVARDIKSYKRALEFHWENREQMIKAREENNR